MNQQEIRDYEKQIAKAEGDAVLIRWRQYREILADTKRTTEKMNLRQGQKEKLMAIAEAEGNASSRSEIGYRLQCAKTYPTESALSNAVGQCASWHELCKQKFPHGRNRSTSEEGSDSETEPRFSHHADNCRRLFAHWKQPTALFKDWYDEPEITLSAIEKKLVKNRSRLDQEIADANMGDKVFGKLLRAAKGDKNKMYGEVVEILISKIPDSESVPS